MSVPTCSRRCVQTSHCSLIDVDRDLMGKLGSLGLYLVSSLFYIMSLLNLSQFFVDTFEMLPAFTKRLISPSSLHEFS